MRHLLRLLQWLRITDDDNRLSLTHLALGVALYCTVRGIQVSWTEWACVVVTLGAYRAKEHAADIAAGKAVPTPVPGTDTPAAEPRVGDSAVLVKAIQDRVASLETMMHGFRNANAWKEALKK